MFIINLTRFESRPNADPRHKPGCASAADSLRTIQLFAIMISLFATSLIFAHAGHGDSDGFLHGLTHPVGGLDHILAMVAVGVWAAMLGGRAVWMVPTSFIALMAIGGAMGMSGVAFPFVEQGIGGSVLVLGVLIAIAARLPVYVASGIVGAFALFHGVAHGAEMPFTESGLGYGLGFLVATAILHLIGVGIGIGAERIAAPAFVRTAGAGVAVVGGLLLTGIL